MEDVNISSNAKVLLQNGYNFEASNIILASLDSFSKKESDERYRQILDSYSKEESDNKYLPRDSDQDITVFLSYDNSDLKDGLIFLMNVSSNALVIATETTGKGCFSSIVKKGAVIKVSGNFTDTGICFSGDEYNFINSVPTQGSVSNLELKCELDGYVYFNVVTTDPFSLEISNNMLIGGILQYSLGETKVELFEQEIFRNLQYGKWMNYHQEILELESATLMEIDCSGVSYISTILPGHGSDLCFFYDKDDNVILKYTTDWYAPKNTYRRIIVPEEAVRCIMSTTNGLSETTTLFKVVDKIKYNSNGLYVDAAIRLNKELQEKIDLINRSIAQCAAKLLKNDLGTRALVFRYLLYVPNDNYTHTSSNQITDRLTDFGEEWNSTMYTERKYTYKKKGMYLVSEYGSAAGGVQFHTGQEKKEIIGIYDGYTEPVLNLMFYSSQNVVGTVPENFGIHSVGITTLAHTFYECRNLEGVIPSIFGRYSPNVSSYHQTFCECLKITGQIPEDFGLYTTLNTSIDALFYKCSNLYTKIPPLFATTWDNLTTIRVSFNGANLLHGSIPAGYLDNCVKLSNTGSAFNNSSISGEIPRTFLANHPEITSASSIFSKTLISGTIPSTLFLNSSKLNTISNAFFKTSFITSIEDGFLANCPLITTMYAAFYYSGITLVPESLFSGKSLVTDTAYCFSYSKLTGSAPDLTDLTSLTTVAHMFRGCKGVTNPENLTAPGKKRLWERDGDEEGPVITDFEGFAEGCSDEFRAGIPVTWGGTMTTYANSLTGEIDYLLCGLPECPIGYSPVVTYTKFAKPEDYGFNIDVANNEPSNL